MLFTAIMIGITVGLLRPHKVAWQKLITTIQQHPGKLKTPTTLLAGFLLVIASIGWILMAFVSLSALWHEISPSGPAPYVLLPWFIGLCLYGIPAEIARNLLVIVRGEDPLKD